MIRLKLTPLAIALTLSSIVMAQHKDYFPDPDTAIQRRISEWQDLKFGLLMHWGTYSQWGIVESWSICPEDLSWAAGARKNQDIGYNEYLRQYEALQHTFNPVKFDPQRWADAAKEAGMKYVVFTTKHHDGFCMFDTKTTDYKITGKRTPFSTNAKADVTKEIFNAFRAKGFWLGAYFSKPDWHTDTYWWNKFPPADRNPNYSIQKYPDQWKKYVDFTHTQIDELMSNYGKLDILWLDGGWVRKKTAEELNVDLNEVYEGSRWARNPQSQDINMPLIVKNARTKQPGLIVVDRAVPGVHQNYLTPEQHIPEEGLPYPWETCMTMASSWSYSPADQYKPTNELLEKLVDIVSKGGNYLLNIGPGPDGEWNDTAYQRLREIGAWMKVNGEAIYGTRTYTQFSQGDSIRFTQSKDGKTKFIYLFNSPNNTIVISKMPFEKGATLSMTGSDKKLKWKQTEAGVEIILPAELMKNREHVWVLKVTGK
ncbi:MAG: alpha-L-fucosidase [Bacteroidota bacterium]